MKVRALSVFEGVVYHCWCVDTREPCRPHLEVDAVLRPGDADAESGPLLLSVADYIVMAGGLEQARPCLQQLADAGRIVPHLGADHITFPTWTRVDADPGPNEGPPHSPDDTTDTTSAAGSTTAPSTNPTEATGAGAARPPLRLVGEGDADHDRDGAGDAEAEPHADDGGHGSGRQRDGGR